MTSVSEARSASASRRSLGVFLWGATPVSLGKTKEMGWQGPIAGAFSQRGAQRSCIQAQLGPPPHCGGICPRPPAGQMRPVRSYFSSQAPAAEAISRRASSPKGETSPALAMSSLKVIVPAGRVYFM